MAKHAPKFVYLIHGQARAAMKKRPRDPNLLGNAIIDLATG